MKPANKPVIFAILATGLSSIVAQIVLTRELLVVFYGNEVSIGLILGIWLLAGGLGGWLLGRFSDRITNKLAVYISGQLLLSLFVLFSVFLIRAIKPAFNILPGELTPLPVMVVSSLVILSPICLLLGFLFTLSCRILRVYSGEDVAQVGYTYVLEAVGAASGGLLCNLFLIKIFSSSNIVILLFTLNLCIAFWLFMYTNITLGKRFILGACIIGLLAGLVFLKFTHKLETLDKQTKKTEWRGFNLVETKNSIYGNLSVTKRKDLYSFFNNGILMFTVPDTLTQEENAHFAMLQRPRAKRVLLVGGGSSGTLWEILKYPVEAVDYVELDPMLIELARKHLRSSEFFSLDEERVRIINTDGRLFIQKTDTLYDVVILNLPDPFTAQLNRFYTVEFFKMVEERLADGGVFGFGLTSSENYISEELSVFLSSIYSTLEEVFVDIKMIPGDTVYFLASAKPELLTADHKELTRRLKEQNIQTTFVRDYYISSKLSRGRMAYIYDRVKKDYSAYVNKDFSPVSYYYDMVLWSTYFKIDPKSFLKHIDRGFIYAIAAILYGIILLCGVLGKRPARSKRSVLIAVATTGFSEISFEVIVIVAFQVLYGYLYYKLGLIITSFMIGLSAGGFLITRRINSVKRPYNEFIKVQTAICLYPLLLPVVFFILHKTSHDFIRVFGSGVIFTLLPVVAGFMGGLQFPLANKIYFKETEQLGRVAGLNYGADMIGSCTGALLVSAFIIPVVGINMACVLVALLNFSSLVILAWGRFSGQRE